VNYKHYEWVKYEQVYQSLKSFAGDFGEGVFDTFELGLSVVWVRSLADFLDLFSDLLFSQVIKLKTRISRGKGSTKLLLILTLKSTSGVIDDFFTFLDQVNQALADHESHVAHHVEDVLGSRNEVVLVLDDILEILDFAIPLLADSARRLGHFGHSGEGIGPLVEVSDKGLGFSFVFGNLGLKDTGTNGVAGNGSWWEEDAGGTATIDLGSHVFFPVVELTGFAFGRFLESHGDLLHLCLDLDEIL